MMRCCVRIDPESSVSNGPEPESIVRTLLAAAALSLALAGCSTSREYADATGSVTTNSLPPRPQAGMVREPARPYGDGYNLGRQTTTEPGDYRWNGNPNRIQEGAAPPNMSPPPPAVIAANGQRTIVVRPGDTLYSLARHHRVSVAALAEHNRLTSNSIHAGQTLTLPPAVAR